MLILKTAKMDLRRSRQYLSIAVAATFWSVASFVCRADTRETDVPVDAYIVPRVDGGVPRINCSLHSRTAGSKEEIKVRLINTGKDPITYDEILRACNCTKITPSAATVKSKESVTISIDLTSNERPAKNTEALFLTFRNKGIPQFALSGVYGFKELVGFRDSYVKLSLPQKPEGVALLRAGLIVSDDIASKNLGFSISDSSLEAEFKYHAEESAVSCKLNASDLSEADRIHLTVEAGLSDGRKIVNRIPIMIERLKPFKVTPGIVRFVRGKEEGDWTSTLFVVQNPGPSTKADRGTEEEDGHISVVSKTKDIKITQSRLGGRLSRVVLRYNSKDQLEARPKSIVLRVIHGDGSEVLQVPSSWIGE